MAQIGPPPELRGKWDAYQKALPEIRKAAEVAINELAANGPRGRSPFFIRAKAETLPYRIEYIYAEAIVKNRQSRRAWLIAAYQNK